MDGILTNVNDLKEAVPHQRTSNTHCFFHQVAETRMTDSGNPETVQTFAHSLHRYYLGMIN